MTELNLDLSNVPEGNYIPEGEYEVEIIASEVKDGPKGPYIKYDFKVLGPSFEGSWLSNFYSYENDNGLRNLRKLITCVRPSNTSMLKDTSELYGLTCTAVVIVKDDPEWGKQNKIKNFKASGTEAPSFVQTKKEDLPWAKKEAE